MSSDEQRIAEIRKRLERSTQAARDGEVRVWIHADRATWEDRDDIKWLLDQLTAARQRAEDAERGWRCFHCDEVFIDEQGAREHFGVEYGYGLKLSACKITIGDVRSLELDITKLRRANEELENDSRLWHESVADRVRRIGNVQWWQELDYQEGRRLALEAERDTIAAKLAEVERERDEETQAVNHWCTEANREHNHNRRLAKVADNAIAERDSLRSEVEALRTALSPCCPDEEEVWNLTRPGR